MADLNMITSYNIRFSQRELVLLLKALGGRLKEEDVEEARQLGDELTVQKAKSIAQMGDANNKLVANLREAGLWEMKQNKTTVEQ